MRHEVEPTFPVETEPPAAGASPNSEQDATRRRHVRVRLRLHAVWEAARCTLDAEPALLTAPREAVLELVDRPGAVELGGRYLDDSSQTPQVRFPLPAGDPDAFWRQVWDCALAAVAGRLAAEIDPGRREQPEAGSSPIGEPLRDEVIDVYLPFLKRSERAWPRPDQNADAFELEVDGFHGVRVLLTEGLAARWARRTFDKRLFC